MSKHRKPVEPANRDQHGDPQPSREEAGGTEIALTAEELAGKGGSERKEPVREGPIGLTRTCGLCRGKVTGDACPTCSPGAKGGPAPRTITAPVAVRNDVVLPWMRAHR